jgi:quinoprotein dehydrogenase-associated probable ABC transporter substrate-binding protein
VNTHNLFGEAASLASCPAQKSPFDSASIVNRTIWLIRGVTVLSILLLLVSAAMARELRVCADPNNLPFSNHDEQGFENKIAQLIAQQLGTTLTYTWWAQRRGYVRHTLKAGKCDLWPGIATGIDMADTTRPYYRSSYVFVTRADRGLHIGSFDDPRLRTLRIGVQMVGDDATNTPPTYALARRGITNNVRGYMLYGDYRQPNPPKAIVDAVEHGQVDVAVVWGPLAGYFAAKEPTPLVLETVHPQIDTAGLPMAFDISMGVRRGDKLLKEQVNRVLEEKQAAIDAILTEYHVPWTQPSIAVATQP